MCLFFVSESKSANWEGNGWRQVVCVWGQIIGKSAVLNSECLPAAFSWLLPLPALFYFMLTAPSPENPSLFLSLFRAQTFLATRVPPRFFVSSVATHHELVITYAFNEYLLLIKSCIGRSYLLHSSSYNNIILYLAHLFWCQKL